MAKYVPDIDKVDASLQQVHGLAVPDAVTAEPVRYERRIDLSGHVRISFENVCHSFSRKLLMPVVEEQWCPEHVAAVKTVLFHVSPQMVHLFLHHRHNPRFAAFPEEPDSVWLAVDVDTFNSQIGYFLHPRPCVVHE